MKAEKVNDMLKNALLSPKSPRENGFFAIFSVVLDEIQKMQCPALNITGVHPTHNIRMRGGKFEYRTFNYTGVYPSMNDSDIEQ